MSGPRTSAAAREVLVELRQAVVTTQPIERAPAGRTEAAHRHPQRHPDSVGITVVVRQLGQRTDPARRR